MPQLKNIAFSAECQDFIINNPINITLLHEIHFEAHSKKDVSEFTCIHCGSKNIHLNRTYHRTIKGIPLFPTYTTKIKTSIRSFECQCCKKVFSEKVPFLYPGTRISNLLAQWIKELLLVTSISSISKLLNVHWETIKGIHKELINKTLIERRKMLLQNGYRPKFLGVDEFALKRQHKYISCFLKCKCFMQEIYKKFIYTFLLKYLVKAVFFLYSFTSYFKLFSYKILYS